MTQDALERRWRRWASAANLLLAALVMAAILQNDLSITNAALAALGAAPLLAMAPRLWSGARRAYASMTLILVPYLALSITEAVANPAVRAWAAACLLCSFILFVMAIGYLRVTRPNVD